MREPLRVYPKLKKIICGKEGQKIAYPVIQSMFKRKTGKNCVSNSKHCIWDVRDSWKMFIKRLKGNTQKYTNF